MDLYISRYDWYTTTLAYTLKKKILMRKNPNFPDPTNKVIRYNYSTFPRNNQSLPPPAGPLPWASAQNLARGASMGARRKGGKSRPSSRPWKIKKIFSFFGADPTQFLRASMEASQKMPPMYTKRPPHWKKSKKSHK